MFKKKVTKLFNDTHPNNYSSLQKKMGLDDYEAVINNKNRGLYIGSFSFISFSLVLAFCLLVFKPTNQIEMITKKELPINEPSTINDESFLKSILNMSRSFNYSIHSNQYNSVVPTTNLYMSLASLYIGAESTTKDELKRMMYLEEDTNLLANLEKLVKSTNKVTYDKNGNISSGIMLRNAMFVDRELRDDFNNEYLYQLDNYLYNDVFLAKKDDNGTREYMLSYHDKHSNHEEDTTFNYSSYNANVGLINCLYLKTNIEEGIYSLGKSIMFNNANGSTKEVDSVQIEMVDRNVYFSENSYAFDLKLTDGLELNVLRLNKPLKDEEIKSNYEDLLNYKLSSKFDLVKDTYNIELPLFKIVNNIDVASVYCSLKFQNVFGETGSYNIFGGKNISIDYWTSSSFELNCKNDLDFNSKIKAKNYLLVDNPFLFSVTMNDVPIIVGAINVL